MKNSNEILNLLDECNFTEVDTSDDIIHFLFKVYVVL